MERGNKASAGEGKKALKAWGVREVVTAVLMSALAIILMFAGASVTMIHPDAAMVASGGAAVFLAAPVYMLMVLRVNRLGITTLFATMCSLLFCLVGNFEYMIPFYIAGGILLDAVFLRTEAQRTNPWWITAAWSAFSGLYLLSTMIPVVRNLEAYLNDLVARGFDQSFADTFLRYYTDPAWVCGIAIGTVVCGFLGSLIARALMRKHFAKAGTV
ncbi:MptD family putative ECF transporter S component [Gordonibacter sp. Marseille-P4307]|uniref:MptD family putative ECF transporter S component n=1 Tax=Gordonibacter sp. Marseille-P4307 TaxID=2161815 RepID=UPI000F536C62|nr:MptD family putative ECF transporter S component [Gordonibacter sp. Marseille-P4307]